MLRRSQPAGAIHQWLLEVSLTLAMVLHPPIGSLKQTIMHQHKKMFLLDRVNRRRAYFVRIIWVLCAHHCGCKDAQSSWEYLLPPSPGDFWCHMMQLAGVGGGGYRSPFVDRVMLCDNI